jgi:hypothetical protein
MNLVYIYYTFNFISLRRFQKSRNHIHTQPAAYGRAKEGWSIPLNDVACITPSFVPCETNSSVNEHPPVDECHVEKPVFDPLAIVLVPPRSHALSLLPSLSLSVRACASCSLSAQDTAPYRSHRCLLSLSTASSQTTATFGISFVAFRSVIEEKNSCERDSSTSKF